MSATKESSSIHQSSQRGRSVANNASASAISLPAVPVITEQIKEEASEETQALQLKSLASGDENSSPNSPTDSHNQNKRSGLHSKPAVQFKTTNPSAETANTISQPFKSVQKEENKTGLPDNLKSGVEQLSGYSMNDVKVHYNSSQPAQLQALAYAQGTDIHVAPGQEKHLPHEAWHVAQQKQGRVKPTLQMKQGVPVNDDEGLEKEADEMGAKAIQGKFDQNPVQRFDPSKHPSSLSGETAIQRKINIKRESLPAPKAMTETDAVALGQPKAVTDLLKAWINDEIPREYTEQTLAVQAVTRSIHSTSFNGTLQSLAGELSNISGAGFLSDDSLFDVLKRAFEADWFKAKSVLAFGRWPSSVGAPHPPHKACLDLMEAMVEMRSRKWEEFYIKYLPVAQAQLHDANLNIPPPDGSQSVTSDIDLSVKGEQSEAAIEFFNAKFKTHFSVPFEPGTVFDINMYSMDWMHGGDEDITGAAGNRTSTITPKKEKNLEGVNLADLTARGDSQEVWSYVKIMRNLEPAEITSYKTQTLSAFTEGTEKYFVMSKKLDDAEKETKVFKAKVAERAAQMSANFDASMATKGIVGANSAFAGERGHDSDAHYKKDALNMAASNDIYQSLVKEVKKLRDRIKIVKDGATDAEGKSIEHLATLLANKIAEALTYANEVYASEGGVLHTVYGKQKAKKKKEEYAADANKNDIKTVKTVLNKRQYIQSVNENVGDSVHSLNHFSHMPKYAVFRSGKYLDRLIEATDLLDEVAASSFANYAKLKVIGMTAAQEKDGAIGKDPLAANTHPLFGGYDAGQVATLKQQIISFGAQATSYFNKMP